jgi:ppGpp synthetase/RelA/SpoT-type nucleotidyltranferase
MQEIGELLQKWSKKQGEFREEYSIHDYEGFPKSMYGEWMSESDFQAVIDLYKASEENDIPIEVLSEAIDYHGGDVQYAIDGYYTYVEDKEDLIDTSIMSKDELENYFDESRYLRDLEYDYNFIRHNGGYYVFFLNHKKGGKIGSRFKKGGGIHDHNGKYRVFTQRYKKNGYPFRGGGVRFFEDLATAKKHFEESKTKLKNNESMSLDEWDAKLQSYRIHIDYYTKMMSGGQAGTKQNAEEIDLSQIDDDKLDAQFVNVVVRPLENGEYHIVVKHSGNKEDIVGRLPYEPLAIRAAKVMALQFDACYGGVEKMGRRMIGYDCGGSIHKSRFKPGGRINIVNEDEKFDQGKYSGLLGDYDRDGIRNVDDKEPMNPAVKDTVEQVQFSQTFDNLLDLKNELDATMGVAIRKLDDTAPEGAKIYARTKTPFSIIKKMVEKRLRDPNKGLTDLIGTTIVVEDQEDLNTVAYQIRKGTLGRVIEEENMYRTPKGGYRAIHYLIEMPNAMQRNESIVVEVQLKTKRMKAVNEIAHELYKYNTLDFVAMDEITKLAANADRGDELAQIKVDEWLMKPEQLKNYLSLN